MARIWIAGSWVGDRQLVARLLQYSAVSLGGAVGVTSGFSVALLLVLPRYHSHSSSVVQRPAAHDPGLTLVILASLTERSASASRARMMVEPGRSPVRPISSGPMVIFAHVGFLWLAWNSGHTWRGSGLP